MRSCSCLSLSTISGSTGSSGSSDSSAIGLTGATFVVAVFLIAPGSEVMGTTLLQLWDKGETGPVAALATLQVVITAVAVFLARKLFAVRIYG